MKRSPQEAFYSRRVAGAEVKATPPLEEFASWSANYFKPGGRYELVEEHLKKKRSPRILELGCGGGNCLAYLKKYADEAVGADLAIPDHLKTSSNSAMRFVEMDANDAFPFESESFDSVVAMMVMEHVFDPFHFCSEVHRILRTGTGLFFLNVPLVTGIKNRLRLLFGELPLTSYPGWFARKEWDGGHLHYFSCLPFEGFWRSPALKS